MLGSNTISLLFEPREKESVGFIVDGQYSHHDGSTLIPSFGPVTPLVSFLGTTTLVDSNSHIHFEGTQLSALKIFQEK